MTKWRSNRSIYDETGILPGAKFEFDDEDWAKVNLHAGLPDGAKQELERAIYSYLVFCLRTWQTTQRNIKNEFKRLAKKADKLSTEFNNLSGAAMNMGDPILYKHKAAVVCDWAAKMVLAWPGQHPNTDPSARDRLIRDAAMIYNGYAKTPFKDFPNREQFVFDLLEIAGVKKGEDAVKKVILACRKLENFSRRRNSE
jgi:hypothetical protein